MMEHFSKIFCLDVKGDYACFTRPEMKVERVSYDVITPSAARAIFSAIFWKPAIKWNIKKIEVLSPIKWISVRRNEVKSKANKSQDELFIEEDRTQRAGLFLRDVHYRLYAEMEFIPINKRPKVVNEVPNSLINEDERQDFRKDENPGKYHAMFERRAKKGQCFNQPYLGCREFSCEFKFVENPEKEADVFPTINETRDLGFMLYDMDFEHPNSDGSVNPTFFRAAIRNGVVSVPDWDGEEVRK